MNPHLESAQNAYRNRRYAEAANICRQVLLAEPRNADAKTILANCLAGAGQVEDAERLYRGAIADDPNHAECLLALSGLIGRRSSDEAAELSIRAASLRPNDAFVNYQAGFNLLGLDHNEEASARFERAATLNPKIAEIHHFWGVALQRLSRTQEAAARYQTAISINPAAALSHVELAQMLLSTGDPEAAVKSFQCVVELDPASAKAHFLLARALAEIHRFDDAEASLAKALQLDETFGPAHVLRGRLLQQHGLFEEGDAALRRAISLSPDSGDGYYALVSAKRVNESDRPLIAQMEKLVAGGRLDPQNLRPLRYALGKAYEDLGNYEEAMKHFDEANRLAQARLSAQGRSFDAEHLKRRIDLTISRFTAEFLHACQGMGSESRTPVFIVGMARSGTTLLEQIVSSHPKVAAAGELGLWKELQALERPGLPTRDQIQEIAQQFLDRLGLVSSSAERITIKTPQNYLMLGQILATFPNSRILHCTRNPVDTCLSIYTTNFFSGPDFAHDKTSLVIAYREYLRITEHWSRVLPRDRMMDVSYEELVNDREPLLRRISGFLGIKWHDSLLHHEQNDHPISTPSLWQARQPIFAKSVERWRRYEPWLGPLRDLAQPGSQP